MRAAILPDAPAPPQPRPKPTPGGSPSSVLWRPPRLGRSATLLSGILLEGALTAAFGFVEDVAQERGAALWAYLALRVGTGVGEAVQVTALQAYVTDHFAAAGHLGQVIGWQETSVGAPGGDQPPRAAVSPPARRSDARASLRPQGWGSSWVPPWGVF